MDIRSPTYTRPVVLLLDNSDAFVRHVIREEFSPSTHLDWRAEKLKDFIDSHSAGDRFRIDEVCKEIGLSTSVRQTRRLFKTSTGISVRKYAKNKRLAFAARQLQATGVPIKVIALEIGYRRTAEFTRSFKELFRVSPLEFRKIWSRRKSAA
jgi:AraC family mar-sox-rob regulon transcriptional activator